jgi:ubiquinone/menaquinone biosynthesis C-methylase UbiE
MEITKTNQLNDAFNQDDLLNAVDEIFPLSEHYKEILKIHLQELHSCNNIVDLGCGTGILTLKYLEDGKVVTAIDIAQKSLSRLKHKAAKLNLSKNLTIIKEDITKLKSIKDGTFDGVSSMIAAHLVDNYEDHIKECYRVLRASGRFIITARARGQDQETIVKIVENSLISTGEFEKYKKEFLILRDKLLRTANYRSKSLLSTNEAINVLEMAGFKNIKELFNKTQGVMYSLVAEKI